MDELKSKEFILEFFNDSKVSESTGILTISEVPKNFEDFLGKKSPYCLVFDLNKHSRVKDSELIMQGSYFLLAIRDYLANKGQTSLLKINVKPNLFEINQYPKLKQVKVLELIPYGLGLIHEFSFLSTYQYLNDKKQSSKRFLVKDNKLLDLDLSKFKTQEGNKEDIPPADLTKSYLVAKGALDNTVSKEITPIKSILKTKLDKELQRIKHHYLKQVKEKDEEVETCERKINLLQSKLRHTFYDRDISILNMNIRESKVRLESLKKKGYQKRLKTEEQFHITDEVEKHALSIKNGLINATIFYYPVYSLKTSLKGKKSLMRYDPVLNKVF